eukprot:4458011-Ditylum_brightwellii.AAC.1
MEIHTTLPSWRQNFNGINLNNDGAEFWDELTVLKELGASLIGDAEPNVNWKRGNLFKKAKERIRQVWNEQKFVTSNISEHTKSDFQPGGTFTIATGKWAGHTFSSGKDPLREWSWITLQGKRKQLVTFLTAYR